MAVDIPVIDSKKPIVFISSAIINLDDSSSSLDYFVQLLALVCQKINDFVEVDLIVKIPKSNKSEEQLDFLDEIYKRKDKYTAIIISPINEEKLSHTLNKYIKNAEDYKSLPLFTIDKFISKPINDIQIPYVTSDWEHGGVCAAECVIEQVKQSSDSNKSYSVLILKGLEGSGIRIKGFQSKLAESPETNKIQQAIKKDETNLNFTREGTYIFLSNEYKDKPFEYDFIFACNDEMALGARDYVLGRQDQQSKEVKIIGFDGTKEYLTQMAQPSNKHLLATVDVQLEKQIDKLIELMNRVVGRIGEWRSGDTNHAVKVECKIKKAS